MGKITLRWLFATVSLFAVGMHGMMQSSPLASNIITTMTLLIFLTTIVGALVRRDALRAFHIGFSVWGIGYLLLIGVVLENENNGSAALATTTLLEQAYKQVQVEIPREPEYDLDDLFGGGSSRVVVACATMLAYTDCNRLPGGFTTHPMDHESFMRIGQMLWAWLFAGTGGFLGLSFLRCAGNAE